MARPSNAAKVAKYQSQIRRSENWRSKDGYDSLWRRMVDLYRGKHYEDVSNEDRALINVAFATKNVIAPSVAVNNPKFTVGARKPEGAAQAVVTEEVLNYTWRTGKYQTEFRLAVDDFLDIGHGWLKVGYKFVQKPVVKKPKDAEPDDVDAEGVDDREPVEGNSETEMHTCEDRPYVERVSPHDMFVDPDGTKMSEIRWISQRVRRPLEDARVDGRYDSAVRAKLTGTTRDRFADEKPTADTEKAKGDLGFVDIYEFYDLREQTVCTFAHGCDGFLIKPKPIPYSFGHPFVMLRNYDVPDYFYPMGELEAIEPLQAELNETRTQMLNHRKKYARKYLYDESAFEAEGVDALNSDADNTMVPVHANGKDLRQVFMEMPQQGTPPDFYNQSDLIQSDIRYVTAVSDYMNGATPTIRRTATEAAMMQDAQNSRSADKLSKIEQVLAQVGERIVQLLQQYMTGEAVIRIVGMTSMPVWVKYDKDYISGEFDFEVEAGSTQPRNESFRRQSALQLVDAMAPFIGAGVVDPAAVARHVLQYGFGIKDPSSFMAGGGMPPMFEGQEEEQPPDPSSLPMGLPQGGPPAPEPEGELVPGIPNELLSQLEGFNPSPAAMPQAA